MELQPFDCRIDAEVGPPGSIPAKCPVEVGAARDPDISIVILFETSDFIEANSVERGYGFDGSVRWINQNTFRGSNPDRAIPCAKDFVNPVGVRAGLLPIGPADRM